MASLGVTHGIDACGVPVEVGRVMRDEPERGRQGRSTRALSRQGVEQGAGRPFRRLVKKTLGRALLAVLLVLRLDAVARFLPLVRCP